MKPGFGRIERLFCCSSLAVIRKWMGDFLWLAA